MRLVILYVKRDIKQQAFKYFFLYKLVLLSKLSCKFKRLTSAIFKNISEFYTILNGQFLTVIVFFNKKSIAVDFYIFEIRLNEQLCNNAHVIFVHESVTVLLSDYFVIEKNYLYLIFIGSSHILIE